MTLATKKFLVKYASRKFINVWVVFLASTALVYFGKIDGWQWLIASSIFSLCYPIINLLDVVVNKTKELSNEQLSQIIETINKSQDSTPVE